LPVTLRSVPWPKVGRWATLYLITAGIAFAVLYLLLWYGPDVLARHDIGSATGSHRAAALQVARDAARGRLLTLGAGVFAAAALVYTARNFRLSRQGQVTDRYTKAIEQLGSDKLDVRIGAVYALERIARDSVVDHPTVMEVLAAFIREHSREPWLAATSEPGTDAPIPRTRPDVQAATTVIGRRDTRRDRQQIDLAGANLTHANLAHANLAWAILAWEDLTGAILAWADLTGAVLARADLSGANLSGANLTWANLADADLTGAKFTDPLIDIDQNETNLNGANLTGAKASQGVPLPDGWVRDPDSGRLRTALHADDSDK
jgi:hypothetical protein